MLFKKNTDIEVDSPKTVDDEEREAKEKASKVSTIMGKFKLGPHYKMERMALMVGVLVCGLVITTGASFATYHSEQKVKLTGQAVYTTKLKFSKSDHSGEISNVYRSSDGKTAYVLFKMDDVSDMSLTSSNYKIFVSAFNEKLKFNPSGSFFIFGSTGYMGIRLHDERGIPKQILDITIRSTKDISDSDTDGSTISDNGEDASFKKYDQAQIYANPGGSKAKVMKDLNNASITPNDLYMTMIANPADAKVHKDIKASEAKLDRLLTRAHEYSTRIKDLGYNVPPTPTWMDGDHVINGKFITSHIVVGGIKLDYNKKLSDGYINQVADNLDDLNTFLIKKGNDANDNSLTEITPNITKLTKPDKIDSDGKTIHGDTIDLSGDSNGVVDVATLQNNVTELQSTWNDILQEKRNLQITLMRNLISIDYDTQTQSNSFSVSSGKKELVVWNQV